MYYELYEKVNKCISYGQKDVLGKPDDGLKKHLCALWRLWDMILREKQICVNAVVTN